MISRIYNDNLQLQEKLTKFVQRSLKKKNRKECLGKVWRKVLHEIYVIQQLLIF